MTVDLQKQKEQIQSSTKDKAKYIAYPKALALLKNRLGATAEELAGWVFVGPNQGGLAAYLNANEFEKPPRFYYVDNGQDVDCLQNPVTMRN